MKRYALIASIMTVGIIGFSGCKQAEDLVNQKVEEKLGDITKQVTEKMNEQQKQNQEQADRLQKQILDTVQQQMDAQKKAALEATPPPPPPAPPPPPQQALPTPGYPPVAPGTVGQPIPATTAGYPAPVATAPIPGGTPVYPPGTVMVPVLPTTTAGVTAPVVAAQPPAKVVEKVVVKEVPAKTPAATATPAPAAKPTGYVKLYDDKGFTDRVLTIGLGRDLGNLEYTGSDDGKGGFNDKASSVKYSVPAGWKAVLYEDNNYRNRGYELTGSGSVADLGYFSDKCSSVRWEQR